MKRFCLVMMICLLCSSCGTPYDYTVDLNGETKAYTPAETVGITAIINKNSGTFHLDEDCVYLQRMKDENRMALTVEKTEKLTAHGYKPCSRCAKEE